MAKQRFVYPAELREGRDGTILVRFPDIAEALTEGDDEADALVQAADCLEEAIAGRIADGHHIPAPSRCKAGQRLVPVPVQTAAKAALYLTLDDSGLTRAALARALGCDVKEVRRMLDPRHPTKLPRIAEALAVLGKRLAVELRDAA